MDSKRIFDIVFALILLIVFIPVLLIIAILVRVTSAGPVIFRQERMGLDCRPFLIYKFRTFFDGCDTGKFGPTDSLRFTPIGGALRRTYLDELPQLWNVLRGDMSLVGPRPYRFSESEDLMKKFTNFSSRHSVRPGMTGLAKVQRIGKDRYEMERALEFDLAYVQSHSLWLDLKIIAKTALFVLSLRGT